MIQQIKLWWRFEGRYYPQNLLDGLRNLKYWFRTIWKDRDYDHYHIYELLRVKLEKQAKAISAANRHTESDRDVKHILLCAKLIRIQQEELYRMEYLDYFKEDHEFVFDGSHYTINSKLIEDNLDEYFAKYPRQHKQVVSGKINYLNLDINEKTRQQVAMEIGLANQDRSRILLFKTINRYIENWWY